jgi:N-acetylglucosaminyldiphosphoundecaprenol N-acetyl-beta-D-mannosaminyltransferase
MTQECGSDKPELWLGRLRFSGLHLSDVLRVDEQLKFIVTVNSDFVVTAQRSERFRQIICNGIATIDGQVLYWMARLFGKPRGMSIEKISGSSLAYDLMRYCAASRMRLFMLGALPDVNARAVRRASHDFRVDTMGYSPQFEAYPQSPGWNENVIARIREFSPHVVLVGLGSPKQEFWIDDQREQLAAIGVKVVIGCGGTIDFISGSISRAPPLIQKAGLEGLYRLIQEPTLARVRRLLRSCLAIPIVLIWSLVGSRR